MCGGGGGGVSYDMPIVKAITPDVLALYNAQTILMSNTKRKNEQYYLLVSLHRRMEVQRFKWR